MPKKRTHENTCVTPTGTMFAANSKISIPIPFTPFEQSLSHVSEGRGPHVTNVLSEADPELGGWHAQTVNSKHFQQLFILTQWQ